jgi:hypothetical protein
MLVTFKSAASGDLIMFEKNAREILALLGKNPEEARGIVTVDQLPAAIAALRTAIAADKARQASLPVDENEPESEVARKVSLFQRAAPLLEMLERSLQGREPVTWGV